MLVAKRLAFWLVLGALGLERFAFRLKLLALANEAFAVPVALVEPLPAQPGEFVADASDLVLFLSGFGGAAVREFLLDGAAAVVPQRAVGFQLLCVAIKVAAAADQFRVARLPRGPAVGFRRVEREPPLVQLAVLFREIGGRVFVNGRRERHVVEGNEFGREVRGRHFASGLCRDVNRDHQPRDVDRVGVVECGGCVGRERVTVERDGKRGADAADARAVRFAGELHGDGRGTGDGQPQVAAGRAADEELFAAELVTDRAPGPGAHVEPDLREVGPVAGCGCRQRGHHGGGSVRPESFRARVRAYGVVEVGLERIPPDLTSRTARDG